MIDFLLVFVLFRGNRRFRLETGPKTVLGRNLAENDAKLGSQNDPKSIQNRCQKMIEILIEKKTLRGGGMGWPTGMHWAPGGLTGG